MQSEPVYPLLCKPVLKKKIWGGRKLEEHYGLDIPYGEKMGEAWLVSDLPEGSSVVTNGPMAGKTLSEVTQEWGEAMIGSAWVGKPTQGRFPLLVKILDAQDNLSVQVHPSEKDCRDHFPEHFSKDETWIVVHADPGALLLNGFKPGTTHELFEELCEKGTVLECVRSVEASPGQVMRIAPGTVHALCSGVMVLEIQEPSDSTFRIYDYDRLGEDGLPRSLHVDAARTVLDFEHSSPAEINVHRKPVSWGRYEVLVDCSAYRIERAQFEKPHSWNVYPSSAQVFIVLGGDLLLKAAGHELELKRGDAVVLPATLGEVEVIPLSAHTLCVAAGAGNVSILEPENR